MRILIVSDPYGKPSFAPRLRYLCDYLTRKGHHIEVYTESFQTHDFPHTYPIYEKAVKQSTIRWAIRSLWSLLTDYRNRAFSHWLQHTTQGKTYDIVFCTTFSTFPLRAATEIAARRRLPLVIDIRDLDEQVPGAQYLQHRQWWTAPLRRLYSRINIHRRNRELQKATYITTISPWHVDFIKAFNPKVQLIYNGYAPSQFYFKPIPTPTFLISYIGRLYPFQDDTPLREAVAELNIPNILLNYHTPDHNPIAIDTVGDEIRKSSICIVLTNRNTHGMMTTKFYEAFGCEKPILCIPSDEGCLAQVICNTNAGIATDDKEEIKTFILEKYKEWQTNGFTHQDVRHKKLFSREHQAEQFETLFLQCLQ